MRRRIIKRVRVLHASALLFLINVAGSLTDDVNDFSRKHRLSVIERHLNAHERETGHVTNR